MGKVYQVQVVGMNGERLTIDVGDTEEEMKKLTVLQLKGKIAEKLPGNSGGKLETDTMRLIFTVKPLEDSAVLSDYGIQDKSVIMLVLRMPGGWRH